MLDHYLRQQLRAALVRADFDEVDALVAVIYRVVPGELGLAARKAELAASPDRGARLVDIAALKLAGRPSFNPPVPDLDAAVAWLLAKKNRTAGFANIHTCHPGTLHVLCKAIDRAHQAAEWRQRNPGKLAMPVLLIGKTGTGKEMLAKAMHDAHVARLAELSAPAAKTQPFGTINCAGLAENIVESELFGHVKNAFTGATRERPGLLVANKHGTVLLDEIGDAPLEGVQLRLLRFLQNGEVRAVGADEPVHVFPWLIAATNHPERLREELQQRLGLGRALVLPPLAERGDDAVVVLTKLIRQHADVDDMDVSLTPATRRAVSTFRWPGNLREVDQLAREVAARNSGQAVATITLADLPENMEASYNEVATLADRCADFYRAAMEDGRIGELSELRVVIVDEFRAYVRNGRLREVKLLCVLRRVAVSPILSHLLGADQSAIVRGFDERLRRIEQTLVSRLEYQLSEIDGQRAPEGPALLTDGELIPRDASFLLDLIEGFATSPEAHSFAGGLETVLERLPGPWRRAVDALPAILASTFERSSASEVRGLVAPNDADGHERAAVTPVTPAGGPQPAWDEVRRDRDQLAAVIDRYGGTAGVAAHFGVEVSGVRKAAKAHGVARRRGRPRGARSSPASVNAAGSLNRKQERENRKASV